MNIYEKLSCIQNELKVPKNQFNKFGGYYFRSCEDILEAAKPICQKYKTVLVLTDFVEYIGNRYYIKAIARLIDVESQTEGTLYFIENCAYAREDEVKKGMDQAQITGASSSYARKYALNGLLNLDDSKDNDTNEHQQELENGDNMGELGEASIDEVKVQSLKSVIEKKGLTPLQVEQGLNYFGYNKIEEIKVKDYMKICKSIADAKVR